MNKWDQRWFEMAEDVSKWSKDPSTKVGCVIAKGKKFRSLGFNGFPENIEDDERLDNRELKYKIALHAECNAILSTRKKLKNCTIYVYPFMPCSNCASMIIKKKIKRVVAPYVDNERWIESFRLASGLFSEAGIELVLVGGPSGGYLGGNKI